MPTPRSEFFAGVRAEAPLLVGVIPFGMIYGVLALKAGLPAGLSQAMSAVIFAGSAQFVTTQLAATGTPLLPIILTAVIVNLRHALYSASIAPYIQHLPQRWKWLLAYLLTDEAYAVTISHYLENDRQRRPNEVGDTTDRRALLNEPGDSTNSDGNEGGNEAQASPQPSTFNFQPSNETSRPSNHHYFFFGSGLALWTSWQISTAAGIFLGAQIPASWSLDFTLALTFIALVVPALKDRAGVVAALAGGVTAVLAVDLPLRLGLLFAALVGILAGLLCEAKLRSEVVGQKAHKTQGEGS
jgi:predicted branched-subunit amino acid permease